MTEDMSPKFDTNLEMQTDYQIVGSQVEEFMTSSDNLIMIGMSKEGLSLYVKPDDEFLIDRLEASGLKDTEPFLIFSDFERFVSNLSSMSYMFRFTSSVFMGIPPKLLTFSFDIMRSNGTVTAASISDENHPIIALNRALVDLQIPQSEVTNIAISIEYCGEVVFKSPKSLLSSAFRGNK